MAATDTIVIRTRQLLACVICCVLLLSACEKSSDPVEQSPPIQTQQQNTQALAQVTAKAWLSADQLTAQAEQGLLTLQAAIQQLIHDPSELTLADARAQWHLSHQKLIQLQPFFTLGHINPGLFKQLQQAHWQLEAWPIEPGYIDYFDVYQHSGIVNDISLPINAQAIRQQHGFTSDSDVVLGMHALAYLLWGENQQRPASDFSAQAPSSQQQQNGLDGADLPASRRTALIGLQLSLMLDDLRAIRYKLNHKASALYTNYVSLPARSQLQLWQQGVDHLLRQQLIGEQIAPLALSPQPLNSQADAEERAGVSHFYQHQQFAGQQAQSIESTLSALEQLVLGDDQPLQTLAYWMNPEVDISQLKRSFTQVRQSLQEAQTQWASLEPERVQTLQEQLESLATQLNPPSS
jgi:putative iron-regulated protein